MNEALVGRRVRNSKTTRSYRVNARPQDHGGMWPALAARCRTQLPAGLEWASPPLDHMPRPVACAREQAQALYLWLDSLPTTLQVSVCCERQREQASTTRRIAA